MFGLTNQFSCNYNARKWPILLHFWVRTKKKLSAHDVELKKRNVDKALKHFDDFYKDLFKQKWPSVRLALLSQSKYVAILNNFGNISETEQYLQQLGAMDMKSYFDVHQQRLEEDPNYKKEMESKKNESVDEVVQLKLKKELDQLNLLYPDGSGEKLQEYLLDTDEDSKTIELQSEPTKSLQDQPSTPETDIERVIDPTSGLGSAVLHDFLPVTKLKGLDDYVSEGTYYKYYEVKNGVDVDVEQEHKLDFPEHLKVYTFDRGDISNYPKPKLTECGVLNYYPLDGASIMPVLALGIQPGDTVLDMCAAPGGKSFAIIQSLRPELLVSNDLSLSRIRRMKLILKDYLYNYESDLTEKWKKMIHVRHGSAFTIQDQNFYDKILVDVPCTNDKHSLFEEDNNWFQSNRIKERLQLPEKQTSLLVAALKIVKAGGTVVYSTCSLAPMQNDGVVGMALKQVWKETGLEFTVKDLTPALECTTRLFNYGNYLNLRYGTVIVPFLPSNFGPMYFCKMVRKS